jgi:hypothetical protein
MYDKSKKKHYFEINLTKDMKDLNKYYRELLQRDIKKGLIKRRDIPCSCI